MSKAYWVSTYRAVKDPEKVAAYAKLAGPALTAAGGRFLARAQPSTIYELGLKQRTVLIEFDHVEQAVAAHDSHAYRPQPWPLSAMAWIATSESLKAFERCQAPLCVPVDASARRPGTLGHDRSPGSDRGSTGNAEGREPGDVERRQIVLSRRPSPSLSLCSGCGRSRMRAERSRSHTRL